MNIRILNVTKTTRYSGRDIVCYYTNSRLIDRSIQIKSIVSKEHVTVSMLCNISIPIEFRFSYTLSLSISIDKHSLSVSNIFTYCTVYTFYKDVENV